MSFAFAITLARYLRLSRRTDLFIMIACGVAGLMSLRLKSVLGIGAALGLAAMVAPRDLLRRVGFIALVVAMVAGLAGGVAGDVASQQVSLYLSDDNVTPRQRLYDTSWKIGRDEFPLGVGPGRFASSTSGRYYSDVYDDYNLSERYGLSRDEPAFVSDTSWPAILGEGGWLGLVFFGGGLALLLVRLMRLERLPSRQSATGLAVVLALGVMLVESTGRPALFDLFTVVSLCLLVAPVLQGAAVDGTGPENRRHRVGSPGQNQAL
jgi:O-antigen ligase